MSQNSRYRPMKLTVLLIIYHLQLDKYDDK